MVYFVLSFFLVCVDQLSKYLISAFFDFQQRFPVISGFFYLTNISNKGAAWGMLDGKKWLFVIVTIITISVMIFMMLKIKHFSFRVPAVLIISGGIGNLIDRLFRQDGVLDFLEFHFGEYIFPVFNFADICVTVGAIFLVISLLFNKWDDSSQIPDEDDADDVDAEYLDDSMEDEEA